MKNRGVNRLNKVMGTWCMRVDRTKAGVSVCGVRCFLNVSCEGSFSAHGLCIEAVPGRLAGVRGFERR